MEKIWLRPLEAGDVECFAGWLKQEHVRKWYTSPDDWLTEVCGRHGAYAWIHHFIAVCEARAVGFCQYYDCFDAREMEDWYSVAVPGDAFSIDYLIGERADLGRGFGREIVRCITEEVQKRENPNRILVQPEEENRASCRALTGNGYVFDEKEKYYCKWLKPMEIEITSPRCLICRFTEKETEDFMRYRNNEEWMRFQGFKGLEREAYEQVLLGERTLSEGVQLAILGKESRELLGDIYLRQEQDAAWIGYTMDPDFARQGYAREAVLAVLAWLKERGMTAAKAAVHPENIASIALLEGLNFQHQGRDSEGEELYVFPFAKNIPCENRKRLLVRMKK